MFGCVSECVPSTTDFKIIDKMDGQDAMSDSIGEKVPVMQTKEKISESHVTCYDFRPIDTSIYI